MKGSDGGTVARDC